MLSLTAGFFLPGGEGINTEVPGPLFTHHVLDLFLAVSYLLGARLQSVRERWLRPDGGKGRELEREQDWATAPQM